MIRIEAIYELSTPAFIGGANQEAELRTASIKGALRFWWRACMSAAVRDERELRDREAALFGAASGHGQSRLILALDPAASAPDTHPRGTEVKELMVRSGARGAAPAYGAWYLGFGVIGASGADTGKLIRPCLAAGTAVRLHMRLHDDGELPAVERALRALGLLGGLGSKARKGFGSLVLTSLRIDGEERGAAPATAGELAAALTRLYGDLRASVGLADEEPEWTALSRHARHLVLAPQDSTTALELLDRVGRELVRFRSWGRDGKILGGVRAERRFPGDHALAKGRYAGSHPARVCFGLPHNYQKELLVDAGDARRGAPERGSPERGSPELTRRASPLILHMHRCGDTPVAVVSFLPARFLPPGHEKVTLRWPERRSEVVPLAPRPGLWEPIRGFLEHLTGRAAELRCRVEEVNPS